MDDSHSLHSRDATDESPCPFELFNDMTASCRGGARASSSPVGFSRREVIEVYTLAVFNFWLGQGGLGPRDSGHWWEIHVWLGDPHPLQNGIGEGVDSWNSI